MSEPIDGLGPNGKLVVIGAAFDSIAGALCAAYSV
jgi:hypothetical protein